MGETGCGKTRLVRYMCQLQARLLHATSSGVSSSEIEELSETFFIMKVISKNFCYKIYLVVYYVCSTYVYYCI